MPITHLQIDFQELVDRHYNDLWSYAGALTGGSAEAEDILHQAFLLAFDRMAAGRPLPAEAARWLRGTIRNLVYTWWRQKKKLPQDLCDQLRLVMDETDDAPDALVKAELREALARCLQQLRPEDREFLAMRYAQDKRITDVAEQIQLNVATARVRLHRLREILRHCVRRRFAPEGPE